MTNLQAKSAGFSQIRKTAVSGLFYPENPIELKQIIQMHLDEAEKIAPSNSGQLVKALIAPHAAYKYSGLTAAVAYNKIKPMKDRIKRVVMMGPCHHVGIPNIALPSSKAFATPLNHVPIDLEAISRIREMHQVEFNDATHLQDHALEIHLPFLQMILNDFSIVPMIVGAASPNEVAEVLQKLWGGEETLILISSDLSHYLPYNEAKTRDNLTRKKIEHLAARELTPEEACGSNSLNGLLMVAREKGLTAHTLDLRNSGDTMGNKKQVVGYGSWLFCTDNKFSSKNYHSDNIEDSTQKLVDDHGELMLLTAAKSIINTLSPNQIPEAKLETFPEELKQNRACFVTLTKHEELRGCIGSLHPSHPLLKDIAYNAYNAAFQDSRFPKLTLEELKANNIAITISILSPMEPISFTDEEDLIGKLKPGIDGLVLSDGECRGVFLPVVWKDLPEPKKFINHLKRKAGLPETYWSNNIKVWRYITKSISSNDLPEQLNLWRTN